MVIPINLADDVKLRDHEVMYELKPIQYYKLIQYLDVEVYQKKKFVCSITLPVQIWNDDEALESLVLKVIRGINK